MLLTTGPLTQADWGEQGLVAKLLIGLVLNEHAACNTDLQALRAFLKLAWQEDATPDSAQHFQVMNEFVAGRATGDGDGTRFDAVLTLRKQWVCGIEAKYFDTLKAEQVARERSAICRLATACGYSEGRILLVAPEAELADVASSARRADVREAILGTEHHPTGGGVGLISWEAILAVLQRNGPPQLARDIDGWVTAQPVRKEYGLRLAPHPTIEASSIWLAILAGEASMPQGVAVRHWDGGNRAARYQASAEVDDLFRVCPHWVRTAYDWVVQAAHEVVGSDLQQTARQSGWIVLSPPGRKTNDCLAYPTLEHLALVFDEDQLLADRHGPPRVVRFCDYENRNRFGHPWFKKREHRLVVMVLEQGEYDLDPGTSDAVRHLFSRPRSPHMQSNRLAPAH